MMNDLTASPFLRLPQAARSIALAACGMALSMTGCSSVFLFSGSPDLNDTGRRQVVQPAIVIEANTISQNNSSGIRIRGDLPVRIDSCEIRANGRAGIRAERAALLTVSGTTIARNGASGVAADNGSRLHVRASRIYRNDQGGIRFRKGGTAGREPAVLTVTKSSIYRNGQGGIQVVTDPGAGVDFLIAQSRIRRNRKTGIRIDNNVRSIIRNNEISQNGTAGIALYATAAPPPQLDLFENRISFNRGAGVFVHSGISGRRGISNNWIHNNQRAGIACGLWGMDGLRNVNLGIFHNTIVANGSNEEGAGIRNDGNGRVVIRNNIIAYNFTTGVITGNCRQATHNLLFANGETSIDRDSSRDKSFRIDKVQYAGCSGRQWGDVLAPPRFTDPDGYDFSLRPDSPARNRAAQLPGSYFRSFAGRHLGALVRPPASYRRPTKKRGAP